MKVENNQVRVHRNLHRAKVGGPQWVLTERGRVAEYVEAITLTNVTTRIQRAGQRKCRKDQVRSVCGFLDGRRKTGKRPSGRWERIGFDPRVDETFMASGRPWTRAEAVALENDGSAWVLAPEWLD